jgi:hypothetical protein
LAAAGNRVLARRIAELTGGSREVIRREVDWQGARTVNQVYHPANDRMTGATTLGINLPVLNGNLITQAGGAAAVRNAIQGPTIGGRRLENGTHQVWVDVVPRNRAGFDEDLPVNGPWTANGTKRQAFLATEGAPEANALMNDLNGATTLEVTGEGGSHQALQEQVRAHEDRHGRDHEAVVDDILVPWDRRLWWSKGVVRTTKYEGAGRAEAEAALYADVGGTPDQIADRLEAAWGNRSDVFHRTTAGTTTVHPPDVSPTGDQVTVTITQP